MMPVRNFYCSFIRTNGLIIFLHCNVYVSLIQKTQERTFIQFNSHLANSQRFLEFACYMKNERIRSVVSCTKWFQFYKNLTMFFCFIKFPFHTSKVVPAVPGMCLAILRI